jgi:BON domain
MKEQQKKKRRVFMKAKMSLQVIFVMVLALVLSGITGCSHERSDSQVAGDVQGKISSDAMLAGRQISINANKGVVTLSGSVNSDAERTAATNDASQVEGVKQVLNNLQIAEAAAPMPETPQMTESQPPAAPPERHAAPARRPSKRSPSGSSSSSVTTRDYSSPAPGTNTAGNTYGSSTAAAPAVPQHVTVPEGTTLQIRTVEGLSSERSQPNDVFHGTLNSEVMVGETVAIPAGADVEGRVIDAKNAGHYTGQSGLTLQLTRISFNGQSYNIVSDQWSKQGTARGKNTAGKVAGGAAVGAVLGGIFGGGKGAAIGATAGAGAGAGANTITRGQQVELKPESLLTFRLQNPISVTPSNSNRTHGQRIEPSSDQQ